MTSFLPLRQALDNFTKATQTQIDRFELKQVLLTHHFLLMDLLTAS